MNNVIEKLIEIQRQVDQKERFNDILDVRSDFFSNEEFERLNQYSNPYKINIELKNVLRDKYKKAEEDEITIIDFWIINNWGGIQGFKRNERNIKKIDAFKNQLSKKKLTKDSFTTISSLSKVASFLNPKEYVIYDSRVIYALNWLILTTENNNGFKISYFPIPPGRNKNIAKFDMNTIINISHIEELNKGILLFDSYKSAYFRYCEFVKNSTSDIFGPNSEPYLLEMLLYTIADREVFIEILNSVSIDIEL